MAKLDFYNNSKTWNFYMNEDVKASIRENKEEISSEFNILIGKFLEIENLILAAQNCDEAKIQLKNLKKLVKKQDYPLLFSHLYLLESDIERDIGNLTKAMQLIDSAIKSFENNSEDYIFGKIKSYQSKAGLHYHIGDYPEARMCCEIALNQIINKKKYIVSFIGLSNNLATVLQAQGEEKKASEIYNKAIGMAKTENKTNNYVRIANNLGDLYLQLGEYKKADFFLQEGIKIAKRENYQELFSFFNLNIATLYSNQGKFHDAEKYFEVGKELTKNKVNYIYPIFIAEMALHFRRKGNYSKAIELFKESIILYQEKKMANKEYIITLCNFAEILSVVDNFPEAFKYLTEARLLSSQKKSQDLAIRTKLVFSKILLMKNDYESANYVLAEITEKLREEISHNLQIECKLANVESLLLNYQQTQEKTTLDKINEVLFRVIKMAEEKHLIPYQIHAKYLQSIMIAMNPEKIEKAVEKLSTTIKLAKENEISRLENLGGIILAELERKVWNKQELAKMLIQNYNLIRDQAKISWDDEELVKNIAMVLISMSDFGPDIIASYNKPVELDDTNGIRVATFITVSIGQGGEYHEGLFGPLPLSSPKNYLAIIYSHILKDEKAKDQRLQQSNLALLTLFIPEALIKFFNNRQHIQEIINFSIQDVESLSEISDQILEKITTNIIGEIIPTIPS